MASSKQIQHLTSLQDLPTTFKGVLLDQFGVLHDGQTPYPGAIEAVEYLAFTRRMKLLIISNSSRRSSGALANLSKMGFPPDAFYGVITSGEVTHDALTHRPTPFWRSRSRCIHITWSARGAISLEGLNIEVTQDPKEADFILAHGTEAIGTAVSGHDAHPTPLHEIKTLLEQCAHYNLPLVVANPDIVTVHGTELRTMPGTLARWYRTFCRTPDLIHLMGKPATIIYDKALGMLQLGRDEVVMVGDSLAHDILGAGRAGLRSVFVGGGIHAKEVLVGSSCEGEGGSRVDEARLKEAIALVSEGGGDGATPPIPEFTIPYFRC